MALSITIKILWLNWLIGLWQLSAMGFQVRQREQTRPQLQHRGTAQLVAVLQCQLWAAATHERV